MPVRIAPLHGFPGVHGIRPAARDGRDAAGADVVAGGELLELVVLAGERGPGAERGDDSREQRAGGGAAAHKPGYVRGGALRGDGRVDKLGGNRPRAVCRAAWHQCRAMGERTLPGPPPALQQVRQRGRRAAHHRRDSIQQLEQRPHLGPGADVVPRHRFTVLYGTPQQPRHCQPRGAAQAAARRRRDRDVLPEHGHRTHGRARHLQRGRGERRGRGAGVLLGVPDNSAGDDVGVGVEGGVDVRAEQHAVPEGAAGQLATVARGRLRARHGAVPGAARGWEHGRGAQAARRGDDP
mmetsp:Transcript_6163/g.21663  ORF Transcript_6163/g.21663 Transcript_6163/m.21663 type:complete len:295 (+) Transcript_6163:352-1236(+)